jgi:hypothetical protein
MARRRLPSALLLLALVAGSGCASFPQAPPEVQERARAQPVLSALLSVRVSGDAVRGRAQTLVAFSRPSSLRVEIPSPTGARLVVVAKDGALTAVFPRAQALYLGHADPETLGALLGVALGPGEIMDLLVGLPPARLRNVRFAWGPQLPERVEATLPDGTRLSARVREPETPGTLPPTAFEAPLRPTYRSVSLEEARDLLEHL